jgi:hypothetical protein
MTTLPIGTQYLTLKDCGTTKSGKTHIYEVGSESSGVKLGEIRWFGQWRQYCFYPEDQTIWNENCMYSVVQVLRSLNRNKREANASAST